MLDATNLITNAVRLLGPKHVTLSCKALRCTPNIVASCHQYRSGLALKCLSSTKCAGAELCLPGQCPVATLIGRNRLFQAPNQAYLYSARAPEGCRRLPGAVIWSYDRYHCRWSGGFQTTPRRTKDSCLAECQVAATNQILFNMSVKLQVKLGKLSPTAPTR